MAKQTMKIRSTRANVANSTEHLNAPSVPIKTALEMAMEKSGLLVNRDVKPTISVNLLEMYETLEKQMTMLRLAIHYDKVDKGLVPGVEPIVPIAPPPEPVNYKTGRLLLDTEIHIIGKSKISKPKTYNVKAESIHSDDFEETPATTVKAATKTRDDVKAGKESFTDTFRDAVLEAYAQLKPGTWLTAHTVPKAETPELARKFRVYFELHHLGGKILLKRLAAKKTWKAFEAEIPLVNGKLNREMIPAYASKK
jgi:hypothetical protein